MSDPRQPPFGNRDVTTTLYNIIIPVAVLKGKNLWKLWRGTKSAFQPVPKNNKKTTLDRVKLLTFNAILTKVDKKEHEGETTVILVLTAGFISFQFQRNAKNDVTP